MDQQHQRASLADVISYQPDKYYSDEEVALIRNTFKNNPKLLKVLRKALLPTISDPDMPIEQMSDIFMQGIDWLQMPAEHAKSIMQGRTEAVKFVMGGLIMLKDIANSEGESPYTKLLREKKNSAK